MFAVLPASSRPAPVHPVVPLAATLVHAGIVLFGVIVTRQVITRQVSVVSRDAMPLYVARRAAVAPMAPRQAAPATPLDPAPTLARPLSAPVVVPLSLPAIERGARVAIPGTVPSIGGPVRGLADGPGGAAPHADPYRGNEVDEPAQLAHAVTPTYPPALRAIGREGVVVLRYVVDTLGGVEAGSIVVIESSDALFTASARNALAIMRFHPARVRGERVRQLVEQRIRFTMAR